MSIGPVPGSTTTWLPVLMNEPDGVSTRLLVLNVTWSAVPLPVAPIAPTTTTPATSTAAAKTAINLGFVNIEGLLVRGASILPSGAGRLKPTDPPFRRGATLWTQ